ncbi:hypothetical protein GQL56_17140 [Pseudomonas putida]|nr:hypothetical protein [Pseudomonas putida]
MPPLKLSTPQIITAEIEIMTNGHVTQNLDIYLKRSEPDYAILLRGKWGCGKTHFINQYIEQNSGKGLTLVKVSLFGLSKASEIEESIFQELHPVLGSKPARLLTATVKGALSATLKADIFGDGDRETEFKVSMDGFSLQKFLFKNDNDICLILDDLERTRIPLEDILGYISHAVEISKIKTIVVANEEKLIEDETYTSFKEKVIGKTFDITHNSDAIIQELLGKTSASQLRDHHQHIHDVYLTSGQQNIRNIRSAIETFEYLSRTLENKILNNLQFIPIFIRSYFALSLEQLSGNLKEEQLRTEKLYSRGNGSWLEKKYFLNYSLIFDGALWADILFMNITAHLNERTLELNYFRDSSDDIPDYWETLSDFKRLEITQLNEELPKLIDDIKNHHEKRLPVHLDKLLLLCFLAEKNFTDIKNSHIKNFVQGYIETHKNSEYWKTHLTSDSSYYGSRLDLKSEMFNELKNQLIQANRVVYEREQQARAAELIETRERDFYNALINNDISYVRHELHKQNAHKNFFTTFSPEHLADVLLSSKNATLQDISIILFERYALNHFIDRQSYAEYLVGELPFWIDVRTDFESKLELIDCRFQKYIRQEFSRQTLSRLINLLEKLH